MLPRSPIAHRLAALALALVTLAAGASSHAQTGPQIEDAWELQFFLQRARVSTPAQAPGDEGAEPSREAVSSRWLGGRVALDVGLVEPAPSHGLRLRAALPWVEHRAWDGERLTRFGDPTLGLAWSWTLSRRVLLLTWADLTVPTRGARAAGRPADPGSDAPTARLADGLLAQTSGLTLVLDNQPVWWEFGAAWRTRWTAFGPGGLASAPSQLALRLAASFPVFPRFGLYGQVGVRGDLNVPTDLRRATALANGVGPEAQGAAWWLDALWMLESGLGFGAGLDGGYLLRGIPDAFTWRGRVVWRPAQRGAGRGMQWAP